MYNTHAIVDEQGVLIAAYRKMHLFDVDYDGLQILPRAPVPASLSLMLAAHTDPFARVHAFLFCMCRLLCSGLHLLRLQSFYAYTCCKLTIVLLIHLLRLQSFYSYTDARHLRPTLAAHTGVCLRFCGGRGLPRKQEHAQGPPGVAGVHLFGVHLCASVCICFFCLALLDACDAHLVLR